MKPQHLLFLIALFVLTCSLRFFGLNWDQYQHLHPDERFLTVVATSLTWPDSINQYFDTSTSPVNPHNQNFGFFVYGTYPVLIVKYFSELLKMGDYTHLTLVGRALSAILDSAVVFLVYLIARKLFPASTSVAYGSAFIYAVSVLPIQLSHFFAVDTYLVFFLTLCFYLLVQIYFSFPSRKIYFYSVLLGLCYGLALGAKISGVIFLPTLALGYLILLFKHKSFLRLLLSGLIILVISYLALRVSQPYLFSGSDFLTFTLNPKVLNNWKDLAFQSQPNHYAPPSTQWIHIIKGWFPFLNLVLIGLGLPLSLICLAGVFLAPFLVPRKPLLFPVSFFVITLFIYQSFQFSQPLRYFYPIYPFLALAGGVILSKLNLHFPWTKWLLVPLIIIWPLSFFTIYTRPHSRVSASTWIYNHIPPDSTISCDYWDDCLPLPSSDYPGLSYQTVELHLYDRDTPEKWTKILSQLSSLDYLIISSNRLYGSITADSAYYPQTSKFYQSLFAHKLGFSKVAEFTSRPGLPFSPLSFCLTPPGLAYGLVSTDFHCPKSGITIIDDYSDESFTVYDHPKVTIFKRTDALKLNPENF